MSILASLNSELQANLGKQQEILQRFVDTQSLPIIEPGRVTFFYWSKEPIDSVSIQHSIFGLETKQALQRLKGTHAFWLRIELPDASRIEYQYVIQKQNGENTEVFLSTDPYNPEKALEPNGEKSACSLFGYETPSWTLPQDQFRPGTIESFDFFSEIFSDTRTIHLYLPNEHQEHKRYPLLLCLDGSGYCEYSHITTVLDNLMGENEMIPTIVAFIDAVDRDREFAANPLYAEFLSTEVLKQISGRYNISKGMDNTAIMGVGLGAIAALYTTWRHPKVFNKVILQSGRFIFTDVGDHGLGKDWNNMVEFVNSIRETPILPKRLYLSCGVFDSMIYYNRTMAHIWEREDIHFRYVESKDGHNWISWRDRLREALTWIFPGHIRMIYD